MALEASIVERLQELRRWQVEQQERLLQHQQEQRETLSREQVRMYQALGLPVRDGGGAEESMTETSFQDSLEQNEAKKLDGGSRRLEDLLRVDLSELGSPGHMSPQRRHELLHNSGPGLTKDEPESDKRILVPERISQSAENEPQMNSSDKKDVDLVSFNDSEDQTPGDSFLEGVEPLTKRKSMLIDDIPVPSPRKDFNTLLEERLKEAQYAAGDEKATPKPVKRPFLKKGQGLARFRLGASEGGSKRQIRPRTMSLPSTVRMESAKSGKLCAEAPRAGKSRAVKPRAAPVPSRAQNRLSLKNVKPPVRIRSKSMCNPQEDRSRLNDSFNNSDIESKTKRELEEVRIFELLEEKAENSSFCSTSSTVVALLQQSVQSTPLKNKNRVSNLAQNWRNDNKEDRLLAEIVYTTQSNSSTTYKKQQQNETDENPGDDNVCELPYGTDVDPDYVEEQEFDRRVNYEKNTSLHVRFSEYNEYKTLTDTSTISNDSEAQKHYSDQRAWSDCSVTTDSSDAEEFASIVEEHDNILSIDNKPKQIYEDYRSDSDVEENRRGSEDERNDNEASIIADSTLVEEEEKDAKKPDNGLVFKSELLKTRLLELEAEIEIFRKENIAVNALKEKLQEERRALERSFKEKENRLEERKQKMESALQEEKKRLAREKSALENRLKDAQVKAQQSKQERLEAQSLRDQLDELREEMSQKESRWNAAQARHRSQVRILQAENSKLKQDMEKITSSRKATKARIARTVPVSNTKAIHQINRQLESQRKQDSSDDEEELPVQPMMEAMNMNDDSDRMNSDGSRMIVYDKNQGSKKQNCTARRRDLYENLLKDATMGLKEGEEATKRAIQSIESSKNSSKFDEEAEVQSSEAIEEDSDVKKQGIREVQHPDGRAEFWYPNGNVKKISADGTVTKLIYYNGDVCESRQDGSVKYFYATTRTWHTTMTDGLEILEFPE